MYEARVGEVLVTRSATRRTWARCRPGRSCACFRARLPLRSRPRRTRRRFARDKASPRPESRGTRRKPSNPIHAQTNAAQAQAIGSGDAGRAWRAMGVGPMVHCSLMWGIAIALFFGREPLLLLFTQDPEVVAIGSRIANTYTGAHRPSVNPETHGGARSLRRSPGHRDAIGTRIASSLRPDAGSNTRKRSPARSPPWSFDPVRPASP